MPVVCGERLVRNHGPFPLIQSEGYWKALPDTRAVHVPVNQAAREQVVLTRHHE